ncbi:MAG TPA: hypothetical protein VE525_11015 [Rubrobacter sp.]|nr:hypothetical protein [Rubrobacter sp.]
MTVEEFIARYPRLWHMAEAGAWSSIRTRGLLSTTALLDLFEIRGPERFALESCRRPSSVPITHPDHGTAVIRDNKPLLETVLKRTLVGMTPREWYETLNGRVFFWLSEKRMEKLRNAPHNRDRKHDILVMDTRTLVTHHREGITLSPINSGAVHPGARHPRGIGTFAPFEEYPWTERIRKRSREPVVELAVDYSVPDILAYVLDVLRR